MTLGPESVVHTKPSLPEMHFHLDVLESFVIGIMFGSGLTYLYFSRDKRAANSVRDLFPFTEGFDKFTSIYGNDTKFSDQYLAYEFKRAKQICRKHYLPFSAYLLAAQVVISSRLGSQDTRDAVNACWRLQAAAGQELNSN